VMTLRNSRLTLLLMLMNNTDLCSLWFLEDQESPPLFMPSRPLRFRERYLLEGRFLRRTLLGSSVNRQDNLPHPLTTLLFEVMVAVVGWASDYSPPYTKSSLPFCRGSLHPGPFLPLQPSKFPRNPLIGSPVSERNPSRKLDEQRAKGRCSPCSGVYAPVKCHPGRSQRSGRS